MVDFKVDYTYIEVDGVKLFTLAAFPDRTGKFPTIVSRSPYVDAAENADEDALALNHLKENLAWLKKGYAVVFQHCRGRGKSDGDCIPYINERKDGLALLDWIREQSFYNGELFLIGGSYTASVHYTIAPFPSDVKGAVFTVQDSERYNICYRNGFLKIGLHSSWYIGSMYKAKSHLKKNYSSRSFETLPLSAFTKTVLGESVEDFDDMLKSPLPTDKFWSTHNGGSDARGATDNAGFPILFLGAFNDIYTGGMFDMWNSMSCESRSNSAFVVSPYDHGDSFNPDNSIEFPNGKRSEAFPGSLSLGWFEHIRDEKNPCPFEKGKVTYYRLFENVWKTEEFKQPLKTAEIKLGKDAVSYVYNPYDAPRFVGGLSCNFGGAVFQDKPGCHYGIINIYTDPFEKDTFVKGKMTAKLCVSSDCEDTCFYMRISIAKERGDFGLRDDITSLCYQLGDYVPNTKAEVSFSFDEHAFLVKKGERLRIDISSANGAHYVRHTNNKGLYSEQTSAKIANNTVYLGDSFIYLPVE